MITINNIEFTDSEVKEFLKRKGYKIMEHAYKTSTGFGSSSGLSLNHHDNKITIAIENDLNENDLNENEKRNSEYEKVFKDLMYEKLKRNMLF